MNLKKLYTLYSQHYLVDTDTRKIRKNTIYFSLKGENFNGNTFAAEAIKKGASYSIVDEKEFVTSSKTILVDNVLEVLQKLATYHRNFLAIPIIGLTGSNGKTTTKELIHAVLSTQYKITATLGNLNNDIGVPLTLLAMTPYTKIGVVEMGANHQSEIAFLCSIANPDYGYVTNFGKAHLEGFGGIDGVIKGKSELYTHLQENKKTAFVNSDDSIQVSKTTEIDRIFFDESITFLGAEPYVKIKIDAKVIATKLIGKYNYSNICAAITIGRYFNISTQNLKNALENYIATNNRSQIVTTKQKNTLILDAYNANPTSMKAALDNFSTIKSNAKIVILGDMFELGAESKSEHQSISDYCSKLHLNEVLLVGNLFNNTTSRHLKFNSFEDLEKHLLKSQLKNSQILIKGSRGMALERIVAYL
jgi:UDP-N-acetylmuramoyl-tripeptide--D-alanyl-D-alanine ligase